MNKPHDCDCISTAFLKKDQVDCSPEEADLAGLAVLSLVDGSTAAPASQAGPIRVDIPPIRIMNRRLFFNSSVRAVGMRSQETSATNQLFLNLGMATETSSMLIVRK